VFDLITLIELLCVISEFASSFQFQDTKSVCHTMNVRRWCCAYHVEM